MLLKTLFTSAVLAGTFHYPVALLAAPTPADIISTYADIAHATYEDSLNSAKDLQLSINTLLQNPTPNTLETAPCSLGGSTGSPINNQKHTVLVTPSLMTGRAG